MDTLHSIYSDEELASLTGLACSRTLSHQPEVTLTPALFCQPIDIAIDAAGNQTIPMPNMDGYPMRSLDNTLGYLREVTAAGIHHVMLRMDAPSSYGSTAALLDRQAAILRAIRAAFDAPALDIIIDPFSVALQRNKTWGVITHGELDYLATAELFATITTTFMEAGASHVLTLGRFEREVDVAVRTIAAARSSMRVSSFSTNTETTNAYVYADHGAYALTQQKILVSNAQEMIFRALADIYEGSSRVIVKPAENLHILERLKTLLTGTQALHNFITSPAVKTMVQHSPYVRSVQQAIAGDIEAFIAKAAAVQLGTYTVSGTYFMDTQTRARKGDDFLVSLLYERFCNSAAVLADVPGGGVIIDRNAYWYLAHRRR